MEKPISGSPFTKGKEPVRCAWCTGHPVYIEYHDLEWGVPVHDDRKLFEMIVLEGAQAGLSWLTVLRKRERYRAAFDGFAPERVARYGAGDIARLLADEGIVRNRRKIEAAVTNARRFLDIQDRYGSFDAYIWRFAGEGPVRNRWKAVPELPSRTEESDRMSRDLKMRGFTFVGSVICYAFMQSVGMVNDHVTNCFRHEEIGGTVCLDEKIPEV